MKVRKIEKWWLALVLFGFGIFGSLIPVMAQQSALTFQPAVITTIAGSGPTTTMVASGDGGPATSAVVTNNMKGVAADASGDVFFIDLTGYTVRVIYEGGATAAVLITAENPTVTSPVVGNIYVIAGVENSSGTPTNGTLATSSTGKISTSNGGALCLDAAGDIFYSGHQDEAWVIYAGGTNTAATNLIALEENVTSPKLGYTYRLAGNTTGANGGDGTLASSSTVRLHGIDDIKVDAAGNVYLADGGNNEIREISASNGFISTIAGGGGISSGAPGKSASGAVAASSMLSSPFAVAIDSNYNVYISDHNNNLIWMIYERGSTAAALITLENPSISSPVAGDMYIIAGGGSGAYPYGVLGTSAKLTGTTMIVLDPAGNLYLALGTDTLVELNATTGLVSVVAGTGTVPSGTALTATTPDGDGGVATSAQLAPRGIAMDPAGRIYITDNSFQRVRQIGPQSLLVFPGQATGTVSAPQMVVLNNVGNANLNFTAGTPTLGGPNASYFAVEPSSTCNFTTPLASGASCTLVLTYSPLASGASTATISFATDGVLSPQVIQLQASSQPGTVTTLQSSVQSVVNGSAVTFTSTVTGSANPTGSVSFYNNGSTLLGNGTLNGSGVAAYSYTTTATGLLSVSATYSGDPLNALSSSPAVAVNVTGSAPSTTAAVAAPTTVNQGQNVTFTATVTGSGATPTGTVTFYDGANSLGSGVLNGSGLATLSTTTVPVGPNSVIASYPGDANYAASSSVVSVQVNGVPSVVLIASSAAINLGVKETLTASVTGSGVTPTGTATFYFGSTILASVPLVGGVATLATAALPDGADVLTVTYGGDSSYIAGMSQVITVTVSGRAFVHPGGLHVQADFDRMQQKIAAGAHPWIDDWNLLIADPQSQSTYGNHATANMGSSRQNADLDAHTAYLNALRWRISGDTVHADAAKNILNLWASRVNQVPTGTDIPGLIGIAIQDFALAGETLRGYSGWSDADFAAFQNMFTNYLYPVVNNFLTNHNGAAVDHYWANWDACNLGALIAMGVLNDNTDWFNQGVTYYQSGVGNGAINHAVWPLYNNGTLGQWQEAGRDQEHAQLGVGLLGYAAQTAWNQGVDLFSYNSNRLLAGAEYVSQYNMNQPVPYTPYNNSDNVLQYYVATNGQDRLDRPVWELLYNHYGILQGLSTPNTQAMAQLLRPELGSIDHFGYGTLTFTLNPAASPYPPSPIPPVPVGLNATASVGQVFLNWGTVSTANGFNVLSSTSSSGPYTIIANLTQSTLPQFIDTTPTNGTTYYYEVQAVNQSGTSASSAYVSATPMAAGALPSGWLDADVGTVQTAGSAQYATAASNTFVVTGQGSRIGSTADSFNYAYQQVTGDFTLTARVANVSGSLSNTGVMMRETLDAGSTAATMVLGSTGGRTAATGSRPATGAGMAWTIGNQYTWIPVWLRLQRAGNVFTGSQSSDGITWFTVGTSTVNMASTYYVGLAACSGDTSSYTTETSTFDTVGPSIQAPQTISFTPATPMTYGVAPMTLTATGGASGDPVTFSLVSGPGTLRGNTLTVTGAGSLVIAANQAGNANYAAATTVVGTIVVNPAVLNVGVIGSPSRVFGQVNPTFSYTIGPFVGTDTQASATTGAPTLTTAAAPKSAAGSYPITATQGTLAAANYVFNPVGGTLSVNGNAPQAILFSALANFTHGTNAPLVAIATSGLPITYLVRGPASVNNSTGVLTLTGTGNVTVTATQTGDTNFAGATSVSHTFTAQ